MVINGIDVSMDDWHREDVAHKGPPRAVAFVQLATRYLCLVSCK